MSNYPPQYAYPSAPPVVRVLPSPPRFHWGVLLALQIVTFGMFGLVWYMVQALWIKRATGRTKAFWWALAYILYLPAVFLLAIVVAVVAAVSHVPYSEVSGPMNLLVRLAGFVIGIGTAFALKGELEREPIGMSLSGAMTFFFGTIYLQYHIRDWTPEGGDGVAPVTQALGLGGAMAPIVVESPVDPGTLAG